MSLAFTPSAPMLKRLMSKILSWLLTFAIAGLSGHLEAGTPDTRELHLTKANWISPAKQQGRTNTCWSFATVALLESEAHRLGRGDFDLSPIWFAREAYPLKALAYVRSHGENRFEDGGLAHDVLDLLRERGCLPTSAYTGLHAGTTSHDHFEMHALLKGYVRALSKFGGDEPLSGTWSAGSLNAPWLEGLKGILDAYLGAPPTSFMYQGKSYTPRTFADEVLRLNPADYLEIASSSRWPFHTQGDLQLPDNWQHRPMYNLPLDEFQQLVDHAIEAGFTVAVSIDKRRPESTNPSPFLLALNEDKSTDFGQDRRDSLLESWRTEDIHLIQLYGLAADNQGRRYYVAKDSLSPADELGAEYFNKNYLSVPALRTRVNFLLVHKDALPDGIRQKLGL